MENSSSTDVLQLQERIGRRILLFPLPLQGHINPMLHLANILHSNGFSVTIIHTKLNSPTAESYPHFTFHLISDGFFEPAATTTDILALISLLNVQCVEPFRQALSELSSDVSGDPIACLISDAMLYFTAHVAKSFNLPRIVLRTGGVASFLTFAAFPVLIEKGYLPIQDARLEEPVVELPPLRVKDLPIVNTSTPDKLYELLENMVQGTKASSGLIFNSFQELEQAAVEKLRQDFPIPVFLIGPFHKLPGSKSSSFLITGDQSSISWLDNQADNSVVYVSFGSIASVQEKEFVEIAWGLANSKRPFLWVVRGTELLELLPPDFLDSLNGRGHIVKWAPQLEILSHRAVGVFWTHNGWNSTLESICEGVPMISMPCFTDQLVNARYVSHVWGVGLQVENGIQRENVEKTIERLIVQGVSERALVLKEKADACVQPGGSSYESLKSLKHYISFF